MKTITVHAAPSEYILEEGILKALEIKLIERNIKKALIVTGSKSWEAVEPYLPDFHEVQIDKYTYNGECSFSEIDNIAKLMKDFDAIIAIGGGKVIDLGKAAAAEVHKPVVVIPTVASNCAPWTPLSVLYDDTGAFIRYDVYPVASSLLLVEPQLLLEGPRDLFIAGIGDTIAKWYEADVQLKLMEEKTVPMLISYESAKQCKELLLKHSVKAIEAVDAGIVNTEFIKVIEVMFMYAGMVGGYGDHYGRTAGAHSIHNGLTAIEASHQVLHGVKVSYGICVQLMLEDRVDEIQQLSPFYEALHLPQSLKEMGLLDISEQQMLQVAEKATESHESIHLMPIGVIDAERVANAMRELEILIN